MNRHHVLLIHGIGNQEKGFSKSLGGNIREACGNHLEEIPGRPQDPWSAINVQEVLWADATQRVQDQLWKRLYGKRLGTKVYSFWSWTDPSTWGARLQDMALLREFIVSYLGDAVAYDEPDRNPQNGSPTKYIGIHDAVMKSITACAAEAAAQGANQNDPALLTIVAHSFGSVIAKDLYDDCINGRHNRRWPDQLKLANFITLGSPLALYAVQFDSLDDFQPIAVPDPDGVWLNVYDPQDVLGFPLKPLNGRFEREVLADIRLNAGSMLNPLSMTPLSHEYYWNDSTVAEIIGRKLAIDYVREGRLLPPPDIRRHYDVYREWVLDI